MQTAQSNMSEDIFLTFILGKKKRKTKMSVEMPEEHLLCQCRKGSRG